MSERIVNDAIHLNNAILEMVDVKSSDLLDNEFFGDVHLKFRNGMLIQFVKEESVTLEKR
jgi:hypothetical protein